MLVRSLRVGRLLSNSTISNMELEKLLANAHVRMKSKERVISKLKRLICGGPQQLQVVTDFDFTLSKSKAADGSRGMLTHDIFFNRMDQEKQSECAALCTMFLPIEHDPHMNAAEKTPHMVKWWDSIHQLISQLHFHKRDLDVFLQESNLELRHNSVDFLRRSESCGIPVLVFSAGLGDVINSILSRHFGSVPSNTTVISNFMKFNDKGIICGFYPPLIHTFNKNAQILRENGDKMNEMKHRPHVLLLGDSVGDLNMDDGISNAEVTLKVGFFKGEHNATTLESHLSGFDIVLMDDQSFCVPLAILNSIIS